MNIIQKSLSLIGVAILLTGCNSPDEKANRDASQAGQMMVRLATAPTLEETINIQDEILAKLDGIVQKYPSSSLAVKILNGEDIAGIQPALLREKNFQDKEELFSDTCKSYAEFRNRNKVICGKVDRRSFESYQKLYKTMLEAGAALPIEPSSEADYERERAQVRPFIDRPIEEWGIPKTPKDPPIEPITLE